MTLNRENTAGASFDARCALRDGTGVELQHFASDALFLPDACELCPRRCRADRRHGQRGACGASGDLVVARAALHHWEEPPVSGDAGSGTIFFAYCPLRCLYCQNAAIAVGAAGVAVTIDRISQMCCELDGQGALNVNFVTPTHYAPQAREAVRRARDRGMALPIVWNTSGYETVDAVRSNEGVVDVYLTDFKYASSVLAGRYSKAPDYPEVALTALDEMVAQVGDARFDGYGGQSRIVGGVIVRHLLLPDALEDSKQVVRILHERYGSSIRLSLMNQYTPVLVDAAMQGDERADRILRTYPELGKRVSEEEYERLLDYADEIGVDDYFWQEGGTAEESFIPAFDLTGV